MFFEKNKDRRWEGMLESVTFYRSLKLVSSRSQFLLEVVILLFSTAIYSITVYFS